MDAKTLQQKPFAEVVIFEAFLYLGVIYMKMTKTHAQHYRTGETFDFTRHHDKLVGIIPPDKNPNTIILELPPEDEVIAPDTLLPGEKE